MTAALSLLVVGGVWGQVDYVSNFPVVSEIGESQVTLEVQVDQSVVDLGSHYVILESSEASPSLLEVLLGTNQTTGEQYPISGRINLDSTLDVVTKKISGLAAGTSYSVYYYTRSFDGSVVIEQASPTKVDFVTLTPPEPVAYSTNYPSVSGIGEDGVTLEVQVDQSVAALGSHYVILESSEASPSLLEVLYRTNQTTGEQYPISGRINLDSTLDVVTKKISGLAAGTSYSVYYYTRSFDGSVNIEQDSPTKIDFVTLSEAIPPAFVLGTMLPAPGISEVSRSPIIEVQFDRPIQWGVEGLFRIREVTSEGIATTVSPGEAGASISSDLLSIKFTSPRLAYGTEYYVEITNDFVRAVDGAAPFPGLTDKTVWSFTTETAPPFWAEEEGYPMIANQTAADFDLLGKVDQDGTYYFVVSDDDAMLTYEEIRTAATSGGTGRFLAAGNDVVVADNEFKATISTADLEPGSNYYLFVYTSNGDKNGEIVRLTIDRTAPKLRTTGTFPSAGYSVLPIDADIVLTFSEKIYGVGEGVLVELTTENAGSFIELVTGETSVTTGISVSADGRVFTLSPTDDLSENTSYSVEFSELSDAQFNVATIPAHTFSTDGLNEWTGLGATDNWSDAGNWSGGYAAGKSVIIPSNSLGNYPVISSDVEVNNLTIDAGAVLTHNGGVLTVLGEFILKSSVDVNASYINSGAEGVDIVVDGDKVRVEQVINDVYMTYLISAPTDGTTATNFGENFPLYLYDNTTDTWPAVTSSHQMQAGVGYRMWTDDPIVFFSGEFNTGRVQVPLTYTNGKGYGWNLVGNPYSASIDWTLLKVIENSQNIEDNFWVWMPTQRAYGAYSASTTIPLNIESSIIPSNHAFLVKVVSPEEPAFINFDPAAQVANSRNYLKSGKASATSYVKFAGVSGKVRDEMAVAFIDDASMGLDKYDMEKRFANQNHVLELFTNVGDMQAAINAVPLDGNYEVALGYNAMVAGDFSIEMVKDNTENVSCILVDKSLEIEQVLRPGDRYEFSATKGKNITRFALKFSKIVTSEKDIEQPVADFSCHVFENEIFVDFDNAHNGLKFQVADVQGRILKQGSILDSSKFSVGVYEQGVYVLTFNDLNGQWYGSQKVVVY